MRNEMVRDFCLIQALVFQGTFQAVQCSRHVGFTERLTEPQAHGGDCHGIARRLVKSVNFDNVDEVISPDNKVHPQTPGLVRDSGLDVRISAGAVELTQAFAFGVERERLVWAKWEAANAFV